MKRRKFTHTLLQSISSYALLDSLFLHQAWGKALDPLAKHWAVALHEYCQDLKTQSISLPEWQAQVEGLYRQVNMADILKFIDFDRLQKGFSYPDLGVATR